MCEYNQFVKEMKEKNYTSMGEHGDLEELLATPYDVVRRTWPLDPSNTAQGHILHVYYPHWMEKAVALYHDSNYAGMTLAEFLEKLAPHDD